MTSFGVRQIQSVRCTRYYMRYFGKRTILLDAWKKIVQEIKEPNDRTRTNLPKSFFEVNDSLFSLEAVTQNEENLSKQQSRTSALIS